MNDAQDLLKKILSEIDNPLLNEEVLLEMYALHQRNQYAGNKSSNGQLRNLIESWLNEKYGDDV